MNAFGERLRALRNAAGFTQSALGDMLGKSDSAVRMWELGRNEPDMKTLMALSAVLGCSLEYLMCSDSRDEILLKSPNDIPIYRLNDNFLSSPIKYISLPHKYFDGTNEYFGVLYARTDMAPVIMPGDCVIIRKQDSALGGKTVLIRKAGGELSLRKLLYQNGGVILKPLSLEFEPDFYASEQIDGAFEILGTAVEIHRTLE